MRAWIGRSLIAIGAIHCVFGVVVLGEFIAPALREGLFNTIGEAHPAERNMVFWFMVVGVMTMMIGGLVDRLERSDLGIPAFMPWSLLALTVVGWVMMPASGFWLLSFPTVGLLVRIVRARPLNSGARVVLGDTEDSS